MARLQAEERRQLLTNKQKQLPYDQKILLNQNAHDKGMAGEPNTTNFQVMRRFVMGKQRQS